ncbi:hypothetical protein BCR43DRAFT_81989 [Syncephalastrum racemosum]|uniref:Protein S-acyltransferase n=1 Tax=Syncephalastrum racemosum TaxID=13706 RepID=A0A1X2H2Y1_SYNRA|nr:hypothetical protein BCR43DRAFT_81989 [Syncephalastrum racemosum]
MVVIGSFTLSHLWMILLNRTTIENNQYQQWSKDKERGKRLTIFTRQGRNVFDQGPRSNWKEVMGNHWWQWFVPIAIRRSTPCDGIQFGYNEETLRELEQERQPSA